ncbi:MAG: glycosyltransferase family 25 protein [Acidiferrobacterales bacterium]|nr:glycosyltransferase family 25 protein [Acidiferrobacterales bacterium]
MWKSYVINLERSVNRREHIVREFNAHGIEFEFSTAKDKLSLTQYDYNELADPQSKSINWSHHAVPGLFACWVSHQTVWKRCLENESVDTVAVFEDDVTISENINDAFRTLESSRDRFDVVFLFKSFGKKPFKPLIELDGGFSLGIVKYQDTGAFGYVITRQAMQHVIERFPKFRDFTIDDVLHAPWLTELRTYTLSPAVVFHQNDFKSEINDLSGGRGVFNQNPEVTREHTRSYHSRSFDKSNKRKKKWKKRIWYLKSTIGSKRDEYNRRQRKKWAIGQSKMSLGNIYNFWKRNLEFAWKNWTFRLFKNMRWYKNYKIWERDLRHRRSGIDKDKKAAELNYLKLEEQRYIARLSGASPGTADWLIGTEIKYGGISLNVVREKLSPHDRRSLYNPRLNPAIGGDRMLHHGYAVHYAEFLKPYVKDRDRRFVICEFGILKGTGLAIWCDLFPNARCIGFDVDLSNIEKNMDDLLQRGAFSKKFTRTL